jgi:hypothetical protein
LTLPSDSWYYLNVGYRKKRLLLLKRNKDSQHFKQQFSVNLKGEQLLCTVTTPLYLKTQIKVLNMITQATSFKPVTFTQERPLITIEFAPDIHAEETEYSYEHPQFVFGDRVVLVNSFPEYEYIVCGLELMESKTPSGKLLNQPYWKYKVSNGEVSFCKDETALVRSKEHQAKTICSDCQHFENFHERERGWCHLFEHQAKTFHLKTDDCVTNASSQLDQPHPEYKIGSIVKVIDKDEHHTEWAVFEIVESKYNHNLYRSQESYLNEVAWYYRLAARQDVNAIEPSLWIAENEICPFNLSHNVCTQDIF